MLIIDFTLGENLYTLSIKVPFLKDSEDGERCTF